MDSMKAVTHKDLTTILKELDRELVLDALGTERFRIMFFDNCRDSAIRRKIETMLA